MSALPNMRALVTGAAGFVGGHLARRLQRKGWEVHAVVRPAGHHVVWDPDQPSGVEHIHDGTTDGIRKIVEIAEPDITFHVASLALPEHMPEDVESLVQSNVLFGTQILEALNSAGGGPFVNTGTSWQHYNNDVYNPVCLYAATKQAFEDILRYYVEATSVRAITLQLFDTYGPEDKRPKLLNQLLRAARASKALEMTSGEQKVDFVHVEDVVDAYCIAADRLLVNEKVRHEIYGVSSGNPLTLREFVLLCQSRGLQELDVRWGARQYRAREVMAPWTGYKRLPGWNPSRELGEGLASLFVQQH
jgi:nucleoside-diphosphate-sugar epimerase